MKNGAGAPSIYRVYKDIICKGNQIYYFTNGKKDLSISKEGFLIITKRIPLLKLFSVKVINYLGLNYIWSNIFMFFTLYHHVKKLKPDFIYALDGSLVPAVFLSSKLLKIPFIHRERGIQVTSWSLKNMRIYKFGLLRVVKTWKTEILPFLIPCQMRILTDDGTSADRLAVRLGVPKSNFVFWRNGVDKVKININKETLIKKLNLNGEKVIMTVSRLERWKSVDRLIKASPKIVEYYPNVKFIVLGDGGYRKKLEKLVRKLGITPNYIFVGAVKHSDIYSYLNIADIFVSLYNLSNLGNPTFEAMMSGKCIVALNTGNTRSVIRHMENGVLLEYNQLSDMPGIINNLLDSPGLRKSLGDKAQQFALENFYSWHERSMMELRLLQEISKGKMYQNGKKN
jgi:glycosyltransferase involved in cell wall biosynthesis